MHSFLGCFVLFLGNLLAFFCYLVIVFAVLFDLVKFFGKGGLHVEEGGLEFCTLIRQ